MVAIVSRAKQGQDGSQRHNRLGGHTLPSLCLIQSTEGLQEFSCDWIKDAFCEGFIVANVRYTIGKIVRKEGCWRGEKGSKVQGGARLILHSTNFTAPIKYKYRTAQQHTCREMVGSAASCGVPIPICQININHSQSPPAPASAGSISAVSSSVPVSDR